MLLEIIYRNYNADNDIYYDVNYNDEDDEDEENGDIGGRSEDIISVNSNVIADWIPDDIDPINVKCEVVVNIS
ncbi:7774_t:CDS:2 [Entrophospora sp. SA101]|nr:7774_t:CDS:2 [Entrophospora sp. SA101]